MMNKRRVMFLNVALAAAVALGAYAFAVWTRPGASVATRLDLAAVILVTVMGAGVSLGIVIATKRWTALGVGLLLTMVGVWALYQRVWDQAERWTLLQSEAGHWFVRGLVVGGIFLVHGGTIHRLATDTTDAPGWRQVRRRLLALVVVTALIYAALFFINERGTP